MMKKLILALTSALLLGVIAAGITTAAVLYWYGAPGPLSQERTVLIEPGTSFQRIAKQLEDKGVIDHALAFRAIVMAKGAHTQFKAGEYAFETGISPQEAAQILMRGESIRHAVTIPEGKNSAEILSILLKDDRLSGIVSAPIAEGSLLPDTYHIHRGDARASLIARMQQAQSALLEELWPQRQEGLPVSSAQEAVILASVVEKETGVDGERGKVARVFINRLNRGMPLQSDPTVVYALELESGPMNRPLYRKDWRFEHPYNTYVHVGLPPGSICHPGRAALEAVLNPPSHDYLYFVATGKGGHYFAKTLKEHNRNIARYKAALRAQ